MRTVAELTACLPTGLDFGTVLVFGSARGCDEIAAAMWSLYQQRPRRFVISGYLGEAAHISLLARDKGVPLSSMHLEKDASNTGENLHNSKRLFADEERRSGIGLLAKDYAMPRTYLTALKAMPDAIFGVIPYTVPGTPVTRFAAELRKLYPYFEKGFIADPARIGLTKDDISRMCSPLQSA